MCNLRLHHTSFISVPHVDGVCSDLTARGDFGSGPKWYKMSIQSHADILTLIIPKDSSKAI